MGTDLLTMLRGLAQRATGRWIQQVCSSGPNRFASSFQAHTVTQLARWTLPVGVLALASNELRSDPAAPEPPAAESTNETQHTPNSPKEDGEAEEDWSGPTNKKGEPSQNIADYDDPFECPCVQTLVQGPCGTEFKTAYLCFINSNEEQKGMDCVDLFIAMQDCFKEHPETFEKYAALSGGDDDDDDEEEFDEPPTPSPEPSTPVDSQPSTDASPNTADEKQQDSK